MVKALTSFSVLKTALQDYLKQAAALRGKAIIYEPYSYEYDVRDALKKGIAKGWYSKVFVSKSKDFTKSNLIEVSLDNLSQLLEEGLLYEIESYYDIGKSYVGIAAILTEEDLINLCNIIKSYNRDLDYIFYYLETDLKFIFQAVYDRLTYYFIVAKDNDYKFYDYEDLAVVLKSYCNLQ
jgi:hypothetical protein